MSDIRGLFTTAAGRKPKAPPGTGTTVPVSIAVTAGGRVVVAGDEDGAPVAVDLGTQVDGQKRLVTVGPPGQWAHVTMPTYRGFVKKAPGSLLFVFGMNELASEQWLMFFDEEEWCLTGAAPMFAPIGVAANSPYSLVFPDPFPFTRTAIQWQASSTNGTLTINTSATFSMSAEFI